MKQGFRLSSRQAESLYVDICDVHNATCQEGFGVAQKGVSLERSRSPVVLYCGPLSLYSILRDESPAPFSVFRRPSRLLLQAVTLYLDERCGNVRSPPLLCVQSLPFVYIASNGVQCAMQLPPGVSFPCFSLCAVLIRSKAALSPLSAVLQVLVWSPFVLDILSLCHAYFSSFSRASMEIGLFAACAHSLSIWLSFQVLLQLLFCTCIERWQRMDIYRADSGVGIPKQQQQIFGSNSKVPRSEEYPWTGFGLYYVKKNHRTALRTW